ncbi:RNA polymerase sigma-70 factor [Flavivirga spongiicola]|uniref:RNA polymerase sigma-70 factor n=1 Tax=Flavivirga spongiicola TaxID=421621 RepID=A0ABU7XUW9_9FLAO|nr:RNA polymerase sigma-70 factor [Flavivirga sp. MEBiC05379]MDO5979581.1 RNA polymerase sigma-70 factor [Flavivirga sp. MEBiC05379]
MGTLKPKDSIRITFENREIFNSVFIETYKPLVLFANQYVNFNQDISEDIVQEVFMLLLQKKYEFDSLTSLKAFLYKSVKNACLNYNKHEKVKQLYANEKKAVMFEDNFLDKIFEEEVYFHLIKALNQLPKRCKEVFELSLKGLKNPEIAEQMEISIETVKVQKKQGKKILSELLKPEIVSILALLFKI